MNLRGNLFAFWLTTIVLVTADWQSEFVMAQGGSPSCLPDDCALQPTTCELCSPNPERCAGAPNPGYVNPSDPCCVLGDTLLSEPGSCEVVAGCGINLQSTCEISGQLCSVDGDCPLDESCCAQVDPAADCPWKLFESRRNAGDCDLFLQDPSGDAVDRRLCELGILMDGDFCDAYALGALPQIDLVGDGQGNMPGECGDDEEPAAPGSNPSGFNLTHGLVLYFPDTDVHDTVDDSFIYVGLDVSDRVQKPGVLELQTPVQFDYDDNGSGCSKDPDAVGESDDLNESYGLRLQVCSDLSNPDLLCFAEPNDIDNPALGVDLRIELEKGTEDGLEFDDDGGLELLSFPTADPIFNHRAFCIDQEICACANRSNGDGNNVEFILKRVETEGNFDSMPNAQPGSAQQNDNRLFLSQLLIRGAGGANAMEGDEDRLDFTLKTSLPGVTVAKSLRCVTDPPGEFNDGPVSVIPGQMVEFEVTIENTGNEALHIYVNDLLEDIGNAGITCTPDCSYISGTLYRGDNPDVPIKINDSENVPEGIESAFFAELDVCIPIPGAFLPSLTTDQAVLLGVLNGRSVSRQNSVCSASRGDRIVLQFRATVDAVAPNPLCMNQGEFDCRNSVAVDGSIDIEGRPVGTIDVTANAGPVQIDAVCRDHSIDKLVSVDGVTFEDSAALSSTTPELTYRLNVQNNGEVDETIAINDPCLCNAVNGTPGVSFASNACTFCTVDNGSRVINVPAGMSAPPIDCTIQFANEIAVEAFVGWDDTNGACCPADNDALEDECICNRVTAIANIDDPTNEVCGDEPRLAEDQVEVCNISCLIGVTKEVRCCEDAASGPEVGWFDETDEVMMDYLEVTPGACLEYRISIRNMSTTFDLPLCAVGLGEDFTNAGNLMGAPFMCEVDPPICADLCPTTFADTSYNDRICQFDQPLLPNEEVIVTYRARLRPDADPADFIRNNAMGAGAIPGDCPADTALPPTFTCFDDQDRTVEIADCDYTVNKWAACELPRVPAGGPLNPNAIWKNHVETIPGARVAYRIEICNEGEATLTEFQLQDSLSCEDWLVPDSGQQANVVADINGVIQACIDSFDDLNGTVTSCPLPPGECLNITFEVKVPDEFNMVGTPIDCSNTIDVDAIPSIECTDKNPCPELQGTATINVLVPDIDCDKVVCDDAVGGLCNPGTEDLLFLCDQDYPVTLCYNVRVENTGETPLENVRACDEQLVTHVITVLGSGALGNCEFDPTDEGCANVTLTNNTGVASCCFEVTEDQLIMLAGMDVIADEQCYDNKSGVQGDAVAECTRGADRQVDSDCEATVCRTPDCEIVVDKRVQCISNCASRIPEGELLESLPATPNAYVEFVTEITNDGVPAVCAVDISSMFTGSFTPANCPTDACRLALVESNGFTTSCSLPAGYAGGPLDIASACGGNLLDPMDRLILRCANQLPLNASGMVECTTEVDCASDGGCETPVPADYTFCENPDDDEADVTIETCDFEVRKQVTCDDPRLPDGSLNELADLQPMIETLPDNSAWFRIDICNTGETDLVNLRIDDDLGCNWPVSEVVCSVDGSLTNCIDSLSDLNGQPLPGCPPVEPGECLVITFRVDVPENFSVIGNDMDCKNEVVVQADPDVCDAPGSCPEREAMAYIDVQVPNKGCSKYVCTGAGCVPNSNSLQLGDNVEYPLVLRYRIVVENNGETALTDVRMCESPLLAALNGSPASASDCAWLLNSGDGCIDLPDLAVSESEERFCTVTFNDSAAWEAFEIFSGGDDDCFTNSVNAMCEADPGDVCVPDDLDTETTTCSATVCMPTGCPPGGDCTPITKATVEVWNQNEDFLSGTHRCIPSWDSTLISEFATGINQFWRSQLQTDKGKARIIGEEANFCDVAFCCDRGDEDCFRVYAIEHGGMRAPECSITAPMLGVAAKHLMFNNGLGLAGETLRGGGLADGQIKFTLLDGPEPALDATADVEVQPGKRETSGGLRLKPSVSAPARGVGAIAGGSAPARTSASIKGSLLVFPHVEIKFDAAGNLIQDTYISITNDYIEDVSVKLYFVNGDCCFWADRSIELTGNESTYWSTFSGLPKGVTPFTALGPAQADPDDNKGMGIRRLSGYVLAWAEENGNGREIEWNHLTGVATTVHFGEHEAWEYKPWAFEAVGGNGPGTLLQAPYGQLDLNGVEYAHVPAQLLFDFFGAGTQLGGTPPFPIDLDTDLTLWVAIKDLRAK